MAEGTYGELLRQRGFQAFLWTQFLGAFNDNTYKMVVSMFAVALAAGTGGGAGELADVGIVFMAPFLLLSGYAGHIADVYSKRAILVFFKVFEIGVMALGIAALASRDSRFMLAVLFLMAVHATFFGPAKYGILPEIVPEKDLSRANGLLEMSTFLAIVLGTSLGGYMFASWKGQPALIGVTLTAVAVAGWLISLGIPRTAPSGSRKPLSLNPFSEIYHGTRRLLQERALWLTVLGISFFWYLGAALQMDILLLGPQVLKLDESQTGLLGTFLAVGIGAGSMAAGRLSGDKVELGLVPLGAIFLGLFAFWLAGAHTFPQAGAALAALGFAGGLFAVPLNALIQQQAGQQEKGQVLATNNFYNSVAIVLASVSVSLLGGQLQLTPNQMAAVMGALTLAGTAYTLYILPDFLIRFSLLLLTNTFYRIRVVGAEHVPSTGPALLICNHISLVDPLLVGASVQRFVRYLMYRPYYETPGLHWLFKLMHAIPLAGGDKEKTAAGLEAARAALREGHIVCIFAEGAVSRTGNMLPFKRGFESIVRDLDVPVIPVHLDRVWGSVFSFKDGKFLWKWPRRFPYPVTVSFGPALPASARAEEARQAILELGSAATAHRLTGRERLQGEFVALAKRRWTAPAVLDSTGRELTFGQVLTRALLLSRAIRRRWPAPGPLGIAIPPSSLGAIANLAALLAGKVPVNLNYDREPAFRTATVAQAGVQDVLACAATRGRLGGDVVEAEALVAEASWAAQAATLVAAYLLPGSLLCRLYDHGDRNADATATVIPTAGTLGAPRAVRLTHRNVLANVESLAQLFWITDEDRMAGTLPFYHSFGWTTALWFPLLCGLDVVYHPDPADVAAVAEMVRRYRATMIVGNPAFYEALLAAAPPGALSSLRFAVVGGEELPPALSHEFKERTGVELLAGYGCTELGPVISVNVPDVGEGKHRQAGHKAGTVGHPLPGVAVRIVHPDTGQPLPPGEVGLLLARGQNLSPGYVGHGEPQARRDGWFVTEDLAAVDDEGFIHLQGRAPHRAV